jgi:hypothetical protein
MALKKWKDDTGCTHYEWLPHSKVCGPVLKKITLTEQVSSMWLRMRHTTARAHRNAQCKRKDAKRKAS